MPRCATRHSPAAPSASGQRQPQVLAAPRHRGDGAARSAGRRGRRRRRRGGARRAGGATSTAAMVRPATQRCQAGADGLDLGEFGHRVRPAGRSGRARRVGVPRVDRAPGGLGGELLGLLLAAPGRGGEQLAGDLGLRGEGLLVVGAGRATSRTRARRARAAAVSSCRLVFQSSPAPAVAASSSSASNRSWMTAAGLVQAVLEVDRAEQRLEGVGEDAGLVAAAGGLLAAAEQQVGAEPAGPMPRATSASARMLTTEARSLASRPSVRSGCAR